MNKKILFIFILVLSVTKILSEEYESVELHKATPSGKFTIHLKCYYPVDWYDNDDYVMETMDNYVQRILYAAPLAKEYNGYITRNITYILLPDKNQYSIDFYFADEFLAKLGSIRVGKKNIQKGGAGPDEQIYIDKGFYRTYNSWYAEYQELCNKYLALYDES